MLRRRWTWFVLLPTLLFSAAFGQEFSATDWPGWRGPNKNGIASATARPPERFGSNENLAWVVPIPGRGHSSPVVVGDTVYLATADTGNPTQSVIALNLQDGKTIWKRDVSRGGFPERNHPKNTEASPTIACDGERLFVTFFHHRKIQLTALSTDGETAWQRDVCAYNPKAYEYGYAASPLIYKDSVIVCAEYDGPSFIVAYDRRTGQEEWRTPRPNNITFSSPVVANLAGRDQLMISGSKKVLSYDPANGKQLWAVDGTTDATCGTMVWHDNYAIASGGYPDKETLAIVADGSGRVLWRNKEKCYVQSMIVVDDHLYALTDNGILFCWAANDGTREKWRQRLQGPVSASPVYAGGLIYWGNEKGTVYVFRPNASRFELVSENRVGSSMFASPAVSGNRLLLRVGTGSEAKYQEYLYCFANPS
ncbi:MAG: PQQ-binding-like beta-propeller repeat protein [Planctomycetales bacterium]|nr:PQQ-binding-like beta-propeller repeat protein [Planctomycetales bacterium]